MIATGVDPSIRGTGVVVLRAGEVLEAETVQAATPGSRCPRARLARAADLARRVVDVAASARWPSTGLVAVEDYAFAGSRRLVDLVELGTLIRAEFDSIGVTWAAVGATQMKKFATGRGRGGKDEVRVGVYKRWGFEHPSNDVVDAYVLARVAQAVDSLLLRRASHLLKHEHEVAEAVAVANKLSI